MPVEPQKPSARPRKRAEERLLRKQAERAGSSQDRHQSGSQSIQAVGEVYGIRERNDSQDEQGRPA
jgi:hypothetical protein